MALGIPLGKHRSVHLGKHKSVHAHTQKRMHMLGGASVTIDSRVRGYGAGMSHRPVHHSASASASHSKKKPLKFKF